MGQVLVLELISPELGILLKPHKALQEVLKSPGVCKQQQQQQHSEWT